MKVSYGGYQYPTSSMRWSSSEQLLQSNGIGFALQAAVAINGLMPCSGPSDAAVKAAALRAATRRPGFDLILRTDAGAVLESLTAVGALIPPQCVMGPVFSGTTGAEFVSYRDVSMTFQATYPTTSGILVIERTTTLEYTAPFPTIVWLPAQNGSAQRQQTTGNMPGTMIQSGTIITRNGQAIKPGYLFDPTLQTQPPMEVRTERLTPFGPEYILNYRYVYQSTRPF